MRCDLLGELAAADDAGARLPLPAAKQRIILAALLLRANTAVSREELIDAVWGTDPPPNAAAALRLYVTRLRRALGGAGARITATAAGYRIEVHGPEELDLAEAEDLREQARAAAQAGRWADASAWLRRAERLWRGPALADVPSDTLRRGQLPRLEELRLRITESRIEADLRLGRAGEVIGELRSLVADQPTRERLHALLMLALYQCGRAAEALECYRTLDAYLATELGMDPGPDIQRLHEAILRNDPALAAPGDPARAEHAPAPAGETSADPAPAAPAPAAPAPAAPAPAAQAPAAPAPAGPAPGDGTPPEPVVRNDLPRDISDFAGRGRELRALSAILDGQRPGRPVVICAIDGMAGVGKTALAVHAAHRMSDQFPDAQLFVDLHGHSPDREPLQPQAALEILLRSLGVPGAQIPAAADERAAAWRAALAGRRPLVVLDNAASVAQVRPLLPGAPGCLVLITSRQRLVGLEVTETISLEVLPRDEAMDMLARAAGADRIAADAAAAHRVLGLCGRLPLAVRIAAARLRSRPAWTVAHLAERLGVEQQRLSELHAGDRSVAATFALSYQHLTQPQQRLFRLLGLCPGPAFDAYLAAALTGTALTQAEQVLEDLLDANLVEPVAPGRYRFHDLIRDHARATAEQRDPPEARQEALRRILDYYTQTVYVATPYITARRIEAPSLAYPPADAPVFTGPDDALAWCESERPNLTAAVMYAEANGLDDACWQLAHCMWPFMRHRGYTGQWIMTLRAALAAATRLGDRKTTADTLRFLGIAYWETGQFEPAVDSYQRALEMYRALGDGAGEATCLANLAMVDVRLERYPEALGHHQRALDLYQVLGVDWGQANVLSSMGVVYVKLGQYARALDCNERALALYQACGDERCVAGILSNIGAVHLHLGRPGQALEHQHLAVATAERLGDRMLEGELLNDLADTCRAVGQQEEARSLYTRALRINSEVNSLPEEARSHEGLADTLAGTDDEAARQHWQHALAIYTEIGLPEAARTRQKLASPEAPLALAARLRPAGASEPER
jgi:DNA-binding SARP family transcriptional activator